MAEESNHNHLGKVRNDKNGVSKVHRHPLKENKPKPSPNVTTTKLNKPMPMMVTMDMSGVSIEIVGNMKAGRKVIQDHFNFNLENLDDVNDGDNKQVFMTMDCEGQNLGLNGRLTLLQISLDEKTVFLFDILSCPQLIELLQPILESDKIVKILHDCRGDKANLKKEFGVNLNCIFDTQVAHKTISKDSTTVKRIGFNALCLQLNVIGNSLKENFKSNMKLPKFWKVRPLTPDMINYASMDVLCLWGVFHQLDQKLGAEGSRVRNNFYKSCTRYSVEKLNQNNGHNHVHGNGGGPRRVRGVKTQKSKIFEQNKATLVSKEDPANSHLQRLKQSRETALGISILYDYDNYNDNNVNSKNIRYLAISSLRRSSIFDLKLLPQECVNRIKDLLVLNGSTKVMFDTTTGHLDQLKNDHGIEISDIFHLKKAFCEKHPKETGQDWDLFKMCQYYDPTIPNIIKEQNDLIMYPKVPESKQTINQLQQAKENYILKTVEGQMKMLFFLYNEERS